MYSSIKLNVIDIIRGTTVDGPGFRTAIYMAGCDHKCRGCHNPQSWDPKAGKDMSIEEIMGIVKEEDFDVTLTGGDPLFNPFATAALAKSIKDAGYGIWLYTGYTFEEIISNARLKLPLPFIDVIVDGPFIESLLDPDLPFRGSSNQRIIPLCDVAIKKQTCCN